MEFVLERFIRGGRSFPNGRFHSYEAALKKLHEGVAFHKANRTSSVFKIFHENGDERKDVTKGYTAPDEGDFDDLPPPEENPEQRIKQLEAQLAKMQTLLLEQQTAPVANEALVNTLTEPKDKQGRDV